MIDAGAGASAVMVSGMSDADKNNDIVLTVAL